MRHTLRNILWYLLSKASEKNALKLNIPSTCFGLESIFLLALVRLTVCH